MDRYRHEPGMLTVSALILGGYVNTEEPELDETEDFEGYKIFDSTAGNTEDAWIAFSRDPDVAERLTRLLNADEAARKDPTK